MKIRLISLSQVSLDSSGTRRVIAITVLGHERQPFVIISNSCLRYPKGYWATPQSFVSSPKSMPHLSSTYKLKWCPVGRLRARTFRSACLSSEMYLVLGSSSQVKIWIAAFWACFINWYSCLLCNLTKPAIQEWLRLIILKNPISCFRVLVYRKKKKGIGLSLSFPSFWIHVNMIRPKYFLSSTQICAFDLETL